MKKDRDVLKMKSKKKKVRNPIHYAIITSGTHMNMTKSKCEKQNQLDRKAKQNGYKEF